MNVFWGILESACPSVYLYVYKILVSVEVLAGGSSHISESSSFLQYMSFENTVGKGEIASNIFCNFKVFFLR